MNEDTRGGPYLSIIIPVFNEEERLPDSLQQLAAFALSQAFGTELIVVDNRSSDRTAEIVRDFAARYPVIQYCYEPTKGKGAAVRTGMLKGRGEYLLISDTDLAVPIGEISKFLPPLREGYDIAIASREIEGARRLGEPFHRHLMGRVFNLLVQSVLLPGLRDTQCGFKCFRREVARELFTASTLNGWSFDVEILYMARLRGYKIVEVPVDWYYGKGSKVKPVLDTWHMLREILAIRRNGKRGVYAGK